jgi:hypothetical protein
MKDLVFEARRELEARLIQRRVENRRLGQVTGRAMDDAHQSRSLVRNMGSPILHLPLSSSVCLLLPIYPGCFPTQYNLLRLVLEQS